jgi:hypothetical protein
VDRIDLKQDTVLITFGAGASGWKDAARRIHRDASACDLFSKVEIFDEKWIQDFEPELWTQIRNHLEADQKRGFGYWIWKPALLKWADQKWPEKQILYVDSGFHIDRNEKLVSEFSNFLKSSFETGGIAFEQIGLQEEYWTKKEIFDYFKCTSDDKEKNQLYAGFILMPPGRMRAYFTNEFYDLTKFRNGYLFNDILDSNQSNKLIETRHDQSIFSILWRKYKLPTTPDLTSISNNGNFLFIAARNRTGLSANQPKVLLKLARVINKIRDKKASFV